MRNLPFAFMAVGILGILFGMAYGVHMSATQDFTDAPAHAHLNLFAFVLGSIFAFYYHLVPAAQGRLAWTHFGVHTLAVALVFPGVSMATAGEGDTLAKIASVLAILSMLIFGWIVVRNRVAA